MGSTDGIQADIASEIEVDAFRRLFPLRFYERHLSESVRPDARPLNKARDTSVALGAISSADGSALVKIGHTTMLAAIKVEVMTPSLDSPDEGCIVGFDVFSSGMINLKELSLISGKAAWMLYLDVYCLDADGALFDAALLAAVAALSHLRIPVVSVNDDGRVVAMSGEHVEGKSVREPINREKRKLTFSCIPFSLTCILHQKYILADPTAEEELIMETLVTVVLDLSGRLVSLYKLGGNLAYNSTVQDCVALTRRRVKELHQILNEAVSDMEVD
ncbi:hypothetical protein Syun_020430 [Stephania yunnanensis]|uniref:Ribosomal RNA-processing protein 43 n=1 Tax=Stephania yunnanensis TaxID=152371 RepID=A0AAP0NNV9_9MAGN